MVTLALWLGALFTSLVSFFAVFITKRIAITLVVIAAIVVVTASFVLAINAAIAAIQYAAPSELVMAWGWLVPDNADDCIAAILAGNVLRWAYDWNVKVIQLKLF